MQTEKGLILALDPGTEKTAYVVLDIMNSGIVTHGIEANEFIVDFVRHYEHFNGVGVTNFAIEQVRSYGMAIGATTLDTVEWSGRFIQAFLTPQGRKDDQVMRIPRLDIKVHLCRSARAKDGNIRQALIDRIGPQGTKKAPGPTYGIGTHLWAALAVAVTAYDRLEAGEQK